MNKGGIMFRIGIVCCVWLLGGINGAMAETPAERGDYLVNTIMACGNCHSPRDANGKTIAEKAFSGGLTFTTPAFVATAPNITPDVETGIGSWSDAEIKRALIEGMRPITAAFAGVPLAAIMPANFYKALLPDDLDAIVAYLRTIKPVRNEVTAPVYKAPVHRDPYPDAEAGFSKTMFADPVGRGAYLVTIGHCMECHSAWSRGVSDFKTGLGRGGRVFPRAAGGSAGQHRRQYHLGSVAGIGAWSDAGNRPRHHPWAGPRRTDAQAADGVFLLCRAEGEPISPTSSPICAPCRRCNEAIAKQLVPGRPGSCILVWLMTPRKRQEVPPE
jgi:mono/diheme cytochrome c family protein